MSSEDYLFPKYAVICEGNTEINYLNILLDNDYLVFRKEDILEEKLLGNKYMKGEYFCSSFLKMDYGHPLDILIITDRITRFKVPSIYSEKIGLVNRYITKPEIEMLVVHHLKLYDEYNKQKEKPSDFLAQILGKSTKEIKSYSFIKETFSNPEDLLKSIKLQSSRSPKSKTHYKILDLLNEETRRKHDL